MKTAILPLLAAALCAAAPEPADDPDLAAEAKADAAKKALAAKIDADFEKRAASRAWYW